MSRAGLDAARERAAVRAARPEDLPAIVALWHAITDHHARIDPAFATRPGADPEIAALLRRLLGDPQSGVWLWDEEGSPARGLCIARIGRSSLLVESTRAEITDLGVDAAWRRRGIGRSLVAAALAWAAARGVQRVEVRVAARNADAQAFWRSLQFTDFVDVLDRRL